MNSSPANRKFFVTLMGALLLFLGGTILLNSGDVTEFVVRLTGFACAAYGVISMAGRVMRAWSLDAIPFEELCLAGILMLTGMAVTLYPLYFSDVIFSLLGLLVVISGMRDIAFSIKRGADEELEEKTALRIGLITVAAGVFVMFVPQAMAHVAPVLCGIVLIVDGLSELYLALRME